MPKFHLPHMPHWAMWDTFTRTHLSTMKLFFEYALPLSIIPPAMIYYSGVTYRGGLLPELSVTQLQGVGIVFFLAELAMTFVFAYVIQQLCKWVEAKPAFEDAYKLALVVLTPLWLAPLFMFIPSFMFNLMIGSAALILSGMLIFYSVPPILKVEEKGHALLLSGSILVAALVGWAAMMLLTLVFWSYGTSF